MYWPEDLPPSNRLHAFKLPACPRGLDNYSRVLSPMALHFWPCFRGRVCEMQDQRRNLHCPLPPTLRQEMCCTLFPYQASPNCRSDEVYLAKRGCSSLPALSSCYLPACFPPAAPWPLIPESTDGATAQAHGTGDGLNQAIPSQQQTGRHQHNPQHFHSDWNCLVSKYFAHSNAPSVGFSREVARGKPYISLQARMKRTFYAIQHAKDD